MVQQRILGYKHSAFKLIGVLSFLNFGESGQEGWRLRPQVVGVVSSKWGLGVIGPVVKLTTGQTISQCCNQEGWVLRPQAEETGDHRPSGQADHF